MDKDEGIRGRHAAGFSIVPTTDGKLNVFLDLLSRASADENERTWKHDLFVTIATLDREKIVAGDFSTEELVRLGRLLTSELAIVCRLDERG